MITRVFSLCFCLQCVFVQSHFGNFNQYLFILKSNGASENRSCNSCVVKEHCITALLRHFMFRVDMFLIVILLTDFIYIYIFCFGLNIKSIIIEDITSAAIPDMPSSE